MFSKMESKCPEYQASLEDAVRDGAARVEPGSPLQRHLENCPGCQQSLSDAVTASKLMAHARPLKEPSPAFVTRVMAAVREASQAAPTIWRPLELLASRVALVAAVLLLALSVYLREFAPARDTAAVNAGTEIGAGLPEPPAQPADADEVLMTLADPGNI
jgi:predicted anti-sigma-YlaC factor YlaD